MIIIVIDGDSDGDDDDGDEVRIEMIKCKTISEKMKMGRDSHHEKHANTAVLLQIKKLYFHITFGHEPSYVVPLSLLGLDL